MNYSPYIGKNRKEKGIYLFIYLIDAMIIDIMGLTEKGNLKRGGTFINEKGYVLLERWRKNEEIMSVVCFMLLRERVIVKLELMKYKKECVVLL